MIHGAYILQGDPEYNLSTSYCNWLKEENETRGDLGKNSKK